MNKKVTTFVLFIVAIVASLFAIRIYAYQYQRVQEGWRLADEHINPYTAGLIWQGNKGK